MIAIYGIIYLGVVLPATQSDSLSALSSVSGKRDSPLDPKKQRHFALDGLTYIFPSTQAKDEAFTVNLLTMKGANIMNEYYAKKVEEQNEDLKTNRVREEIKISLTDKELNNLKLLAYKANFENVGSLLSSFVGDLTGWHSNGSDEREKADDWYERAFGMSEYYSNFRYHLFNYDYLIDDMKDLVEDADEFELTYEEYIGECYADNNQSKEECMKVLKDIIKKGIEL